MREHVLTAIQGHRRLFGYAGAVLLVFAANVVALLLDQQLGYARVSMIFLAAVLISAVRLGSGPAYLAAALGFVSYNFYLVEPRFTFGVESEDVLILAVFLSVAMLTGGLAGRVRDEARRSRNRAQTTGVLFQAGRDFAALGDEAAIAQRLTGGLAGAVQGEAVLVLDHGVVAHGQGAPSAELLAALQACDVAGGHEDCTDGWRLRALWSEGRRLGAAAWRPVDSDIDELDQSRLVHVLLDMGTSAIVRARLGRAWAEIQARERTESLQNALLSSISHDMRTPLAAILAAATSLKTFGDAFTPEVREDLVDTITDEAERLNAFVANLLSMTRLEAGALALQSGPFDVAEGLDRIHRRYQRRWGDGRIALNLPAASLTAWGDPILFEQAFTNVLENALRFSPDGEWVEIEAERDGDQIVINTIDRGPGVPDEELGLIFEKFYRSGASNQNLQGAGLGLSIVKGLMTAMGGTASARRRAQGSGLIVALALPRAP
ncbi:MAG: K+-sensing histidine kinase KdpD [Pseudoalteromonas distincta]|jgi:K+-sensing histidine kinase KdpD